VRLCARSPCWAVCTTSTRLVEADSPVGYCFDDERWPDGISAEVRRETGKEEVVQVHCDEGVANHIGPEPCAGIREDAGEASVGVRAGQPLSRDRKLFQGADAVCVAEGHMSECVNASTWATRRGRRTWHARTLFAREPGDLGPDQPQYRAGPHREGEEP